MNNAKNNHVTLTFDFISFDLTTLARFILTVRKNYRLVPFHNFCHAFDVAHCMFMLLPMTGDRFTEIEVSPCSLPSLTNTLNLGQACNKPVACWEGAICYLHQPKL